MSKIIISDDQNTVEVDGKKYMAIKNSDLSCVECDFDTVYDCSKIPCICKLRNDRTNVIFKLKK